MKKLLIGLLSLCTIVAIPELPVLHSNKLDTLIKRLQLQTHRAEFIDTPALLQDIITEVYSIQEALQSLSYFTHNALKELSDITQKFNTISSQISTIIAKPQVTLSFTPKTTKPKKTTSLARTLKVLEKHHRMLSKNMSNLDTVNKILRATLQELETLQNEIYTLGQTVNALAFSQHHQAKDLFLIALKLFSLTGIESDTGPYLCETDTICDTAAITDSL